MRLALAISGGIDSIVLLHYLRSFGVLGRAFSVDYGQVNVKEIGFAALACGNLSVQHSTVRVEAEHLASTDPTGNNVIPNRNMLIISIGLGIAMAADLDGVAIATNLGDHSGYHDCRPLFLSTMDTAASRSSAKPMSVVAPFMGLSKKCVVAIGRDLGVAIEESWSCYLDGPEPCGKCNACLRKTEALA